MDYYLRMDTKNLIYGLIDPLTGELRYIGQSSVGMRRAQKHCWEYYLRPENSKRQHSYKQRWILGLMKAKLKPEIIILEKLETKNELNEAEIFWISYYKSLGSRLTNISPGGNIAVPPPPRPKGYKHNKETRELISKALRLNAKPITEERRKQMSLARLGKKTQPCSEETKRKISIANTGKKATPEHIKKLSSAKDYKKIKIKDQFGNIYDSISQAVKKTGAFKISIRNQLKGLNYNCKGYIFTRVM